MNIKYIKFFVSFLILLFALNSCASNQLKSKKFKHNTPLIKEDIRKSGRKELDKTIKMGPKPVFGDTVLLNKRKKISSEKVRNYLLIPDEFKLLNLKYLIQYNYNSSRSSCLCLIITIILIIYYYCCCIIY